ncbi:MAG: hypothetical protein KDD67_03260 [Ignavibacteriae bacterium]|nr:hypothetical protein [Ignavibacteriota bacterium]MCB9217150.1 hypothetical protein [Ignavibacteria bacterium]
MTGRSESAVVQMILGVFELFASPGRALIEVFIRKNFGERYFRLSTVIGTFLFFAMLPFWSYILLGFFSLVSPLPGSMRGELDAVYAQENIWMKFLGLYIYLVFFLWKGIQHYKAMKDRPSALEVPRFSYYSGNKLPFFWNLEIGGRKGDPRIIECWLEPAPFFIGGIVLTLIGQALGPVLVFSSIVYSVSYYVAYRESDNNIMDMIDLKIINEELENTFLYDKDEQETRGYRFLGRKPNDPEMRKALFDMMTEEEEDAPLVL